MVIIIIIIIIIIIYYYVFPYHEFRNYFNLS